ncbi:putative response regulatory protein [Sporomusa rhizae]|uniref:response regulator transcription factor n=1 Tax=Sporomusa rhizae TaxID=357999 RepID=UPI00352B2C52
MLKVLIVEDEEIIRRGLVYTIDWLSMHCMVIGSAANGKEGLAMLRRYEPDIVLVDILMPEMNGIEMLEAAQSLDIKPFKSIILTSYTNFEFARKAIYLQATDYLLKPVDEDELRNTVDRIRARLEESKAYSNIIALTKKNDIEQLVDWDVYLNKDNLKNSYVAQALYKIRDHYDEKISIDSIAEELHVSASYLSRKFKEATSHTFLELLMRYRIQKAICLLKKGTYRVYEVSDMTGFSDYKNFCVVFKKYTKTSPTEFMKQSGCIIHK